MYDAAETSMGIKHVMLLKKPGAFQLGSDDPASPKVQKALGLLGIGDSSQMPKPTQLVIAQPLLPTRTCLPGQSSVSGKLYGFKFMTFPIPPGPLLTFLVCPGVG
jgi:hypothetical protein